RRRDAGLAVQALCEDAGERRLAHAARAGKKIGVVKALLLQRVAQRLDHVLLPHQAREIARPPLAGEDLIAHRKTILPARWDLKGGRDVLSRPPFPYFLASLTPALAESSCGCFLPDLTRFTRLQCGGARQNDCTMGRCGFRPSRACGCARFSRSSA